MVHYGTLIFICSFIFIFIIVLSYHLEFVFRIGPWGILGRKGLQRHQSVTWWPWISLDMWMTGSVVGRTHVQGLWFWSGIPFFVMLACVKLVYYIIYNDDRRYLRDFWKLIILHATVACGFILFVKWNFNLLVFGTYKPPWMNILGILNMIPTTIFLTMDTYSKPSCVGNIHSGSKTPLPGVLKLHIWQGSNAAKVAANLRVHW